jgi:hypothetical protein
MFHVPAHKQINPDAMPAQIIDGELKHAELGCETLEEPRGEVFGEELAQELVETLGDSDWCNGWE